MRVVQVRITVRERGQFGRDDAERHGLAGPGLVYSDLQTNEAGSGGFDASGKGVRRLWTKPPERVFFVSHVKYLGSKRESARRRSGDPSAKMIRDCVKHSLSKP